MSSRTRARVPSSRECAGQEAAAGGDRRPAHPGVRHDRVEPVDLPPHMWRSTTTRRRRAGGRGRAPRRGTAPCCRRPGVSGAARTGPWPARAPRTVRRPGRRGSPRAGRSSRTRSAARSHGESPTTSELAGVAPRSSSIGQHRLWWVRCGKPRSCAITAVPAASPPPALLPAIRMCSGSMPSSSACRAVHTRPA
jgi:hypothetical protein